MIPGPVLFCALCHSEARVIELRRKVLRLTGAPAFYPGESISACPVHGFGFPIRLAGGIPRSLEASARAEAVA